MILKSRGVFKNKAYFVTEHLGRRVPGKSKASSGWGWIIVRNDKIVFRKEKLNILKVA